MIRYTVLWREEVQDDLARVWIDSSNRQQLTAAADQIDAELLVDAHLKGDLISETTRLFTCAPLVVRFRIDEGDRKVFVEAIDLRDGSIRRPSKKRQFRAALTSSMYSML